MNATARGKNEHRNNVFIEDMRMGNANRVFQELNAKYHLPDTVQETLEYAHGQSAIGETLREGIVFRSQDGQKSFKAVDPLFLMQYDE